MLGYDTLINFYQTNFSLMHFHKYSLSDIENMIPWEKFIYLDMLRQHVKHQEETMRDQAVAAKTQANIRRK